MDMMEEIRTAVKQHVKNVKEFPGPRPRLVILNLTQGIAVKQGQVLRLE